MFIQLPIIWAFYQSISRALANKPGEMVVLSKYLYAVPDFMPLVPLPSKFLWFDMGRPDMFVLPILVAATTWLQQKLTMSNTPQSTDPQAAQMSQSMMITMPLMFGFFAMQMPAGLSIYFIVSNLVGLGVQWVTNRLFKDDDGPVVSRPRSQAQPAIRAAENKEKADKPVRRKRGYKRKS
jgi:YidC/Oxa1 family membrane protein insertase